MAALKYRVNGEWHTLPTGVSYEVGDIFISTNATSPAARFGGTWTQLTDRFLVGAGSSYDVGATGGASTHTLTAKEMARHLHEGVYVDGNSSYEVYYNGGGTGTITSNAGYVNVTREVAGTHHFKTGFSGEGQPHNNMPPYLAVYMWQRTA